MSAREGLRAWFEGALGLLYPPQANCLGCDSALGAEDGFLCGECAHLLMPVARMSAERCPRCGRPTGGGKRCALCGAWPPDGLSFARYAHFYARPVRRMIAHMKYGGVYRLADWMGVQLANAVIAENFPPFDLLVPVPMHRARLLARGFNHAALLARALSAQLRVPVDEACLARVRRTRQQARLATNRRGHNLKGAFRATGAVLGKRVLLVDDVLTTGETANCSAEALRQAGALDVMLIALAGPHGHL
ncbi:MAG: double zinc ribbon domain-containing protein [Christensenellaceae bacterium]|nr:double zinc ribbon domain-containing protein [Christensenellaceae bacterium]MEA5066220.1 double zinc ribbon domain-containing protein [Eubacteriales bacterium]MEA5068795.1 double zinc ribbon domain-containing protein [Christensenellaceae bacterium]